MLLPVRSLRSSAFREYTDRRESPKRPFGFVINLTPSLLAATNAAILSSIFSPVCFHAGADPPQMDETCLIRFFDISSREPAGKKIRLCLISFSETPVKYRHRLPAPIGIDRQQHLFCTAMFSFPGRFTLMQSFDDRLSGELSQPR